MSPITQLRDPVTGDTMVDVLATIDSTLLNQPCLDHGFVKVLDCMPRLVPAAIPMNCDFAVADAARQSYQKGTRRVSADTSLIDRLTRNRHTSPIEMGELKFHLRLPIFVMRQHVRHRTASLNEESARYSELASDFYIPAAKDWAVNTVKDKQATEKIAMGPAEIACLHKWITEHNTESYRLYQHLLEGSEDADGDVCVPGIAREQARMILGVNIYTQCVWKIDLKNLLHYLSLRCDSHAQYEIRVFADAIARVVAALFPGCFRSFKESDPNMDGVSFTSTELAVLRTIGGTPLESAEPWMRELGWSRGRFGEFKAKLVKSGLGPDADRLAVFECTAWPTKPE